MLLVSCLPHGLRVSICESGRRTRFPAAQRSDSEVCHPVISMPCVLTQVVGKGTLLWRACLQSRNHSRGSLAVPLSGAHTCSRPACSGHVSLSTALLSWRAHKGIKTMGCMSLATPTNPGEQTTGRSSLWGERRAVFSENRFSFDFCLMSPSFECFPPPSALSHFLNYLKHIFR